MAKKKVGQSFFVSILVYEYTYHPKIVPYVRQVVWFGSVRYCEQQLEQQIYLLPSNKNSSCGWLGFKHFFRMLNATSPAQKQEIISAILPAAKRVGASRGWEQRKIRLPVQARQQALPGPLVRQEHICPVVDHFGGQVLEDRQGLLVQISHHCVTLPTGQQFDNTSIATPLQQGHRTACSKRTSRQMLWYDTTY